MKTIFENGDQVIRIKGDYVVGRTGIVIDTDLQKKRSRVQWDGANKTWVSFNVIGLTTEWDVVKDNSRWGKTAKIKA